MLDPDQLQTMSRAILRASVSGYSDAVEALLACVGKLGARRASCVTLDGDALVHGEPISPALHERARATAWQGLRSDVEGALVLVPVVAHLRGSDAAGERFPIAVLVAETDDREALEQIADLVGDVLLLARDSAGSERGDGLSALSTFRRLTRRWSEIGRARNIAVSLFAVALDGLAEINQRVGFVAGDDALDEAAAFLVRELPDATAISRIGGAVMAVLLVGDPARHSLATAERVSRVFKEEVGRRRDGAVQLSIGIATLAELRDDDLLRAARAALSAARREHLDVLAWRSGLEVVESGELAQLPDVDTASGAGYQRILATWRLFEALCNHTQLDELVASTLRAVLPLFRADRVALWHQTDAGWARRTTIERDASKVPRVGTEREHALIAEAARTSEIVTIRDRSVVTAVAIALRYADRVTGVLEIAHDSGQLRVDEGDLAFLQTFGRHIGHVIGEVQALAEARRQQQDTADRLRQQTIELRRLVRTSSGLLGNDASMQAVFRMIERSRTSNFPLVITGETGTGKEAVARLVHRMSNRRGPFVVVDCGAIPAGLLESELFGHEKGAFTGADTRKIGHFEQADKGTIFLDEIGELPLELQPKLLRVLQESTVRRLGGRDVISVDFRLIAATNRNLAAMVDEGRFRQDLYFRLRVLEIELPPLRERGDDIMLLALHSVRQYCAEVGREMMTISPEAEGLIRAYPWPGNVRELQNVIRRAVLVAPGDELTTNDLKLELATRATRRTAPPQPAGTRPVVEELDEAVAGWFWHSWITQADAPPQDVIEAFLLRTGLRVANGSISEAAKRLDMHPDTFVVHLERLGAPDASRSIRQDALGPILDRSLADSTPELRDRILRVLLTELLVYCRGNKSEMARHLGWGRQTLQRQLRRLDVAQRGE